MSYIDALERDNARYVQIVNHDNPDKVIFYDNIEWTDGVSNLKEIAEAIMNKGA